LWRNFAGLRSCPAARISGEVRQDDRGVRLIHATLRRGTPFVQRIAPAGANESSSIGVYSGVSLAAGGGNFNLCQEDEK